MDTDLVCDHEALVGHTSLWSHTTVEQLFFFFQVILRYSVSLHYTYYNLQRICIIQLLKIKPVFKFQKLSKITTWNSKVLLQISCPI